MPEYRFSLTQIFSKKEKIYDMKIRNLAYYMQCKTFFPTKSICIKVSIIWIFEQHFGKTINLLIT